MSIEISAGQAVQKQSGALPCGQPPRFGVIVRPVLRRGYRLGLLGRVALYPRSSMNRIPAPPAFELAWPPARSPPYSPGPEPQNGLATGVF